LPLVGVAVLAAAPSAAADAPREPAPLCGILKLKVVDEVLHCREPAAAASPAAPVNTTTTSLREVPPHAVSLTPRFVPDLLMVRFRATATPRQQSQVLADAKVSVDHRIVQLGVVVVRMAPEQRDRALTQLRASPWVARAEKDAVVEVLDTTPNDSIWTDQWGLRRIGLPAAWDRTRGSSLVVAVLDTGVEADHPDLRGAVRTGYNVVTGNTDTTDTHGHGTSVAGIIAARTNNRTGVAGICWTCSILPMKVLGDDGVGSMDDLAAAIVRATDAGARVINMSLGGPAGAQTLEDAIGYAYARNVILVAAAGNSGVSTPFYPAAYEHVVSVAGTDQSDRLYPWSDFGPWVRVAAPGCNPAPVIGGGYAIFCGTSSAAPVVSGLIALGLSLRPDAAPAEIVQAVTGETDALDALPRGRVDAPASLAALLPISGAAPVARAAWSVRGTLGPAGPARRYQRPLPAGVTTARLTFAPGNRIRLTLADPSGKIVARMTGRSPLQLRRRVGAGTYSLTIDGARHRTAYTLTVGRRA
jgi:subtilisin family serine protease